MSEEKTTIKIDKDLEPLIPSYISDIMKWTKDMVTDVEKGDFESVRKISHQMTGSGSGYGFDMITETGIKINKAAHTGDGSTIKELCRMLHDYLERVHVEYVDMDGAF